METENATTLHLQKRTKFDTITFRRIVTFFYKDVYEIKTAIHHRSMSVPLRNIGIRPDGSHRIGTPDVPANESRPNENVHAFFLERQ